MPSFADTIAGHERFKLDTDFRDIIHLFAGEHMLVCHPFRWHLDGQIIPNAYEMFSVENVCDTLGMEIVQSYGDYIHVVRVKDSCKDWAAK